ncbi:MAG TPA: hypothetical protein VIH17_04665 [Candidatus Acidoferrales bacterium]
MKKVVVLLVLLGLGTATGGGQVPRKEDLTDEEQDLIRATGLDPVARIKLFLKFAADRLQKFQAAAASSETRDRSATLNDLLSAYSSCVDETTDTFDLNLGRRIDLRKAIQVARQQLPGFLAQLEEFKQRGTPDAELVRDTLEDSIIATQEAIAQVDTAAKEQPAPKKPKGGDNKN